MASSIPIDPVLLAESGAPVTQSHINQDRCPNIPHLPLTTPEERENPCPAPAVQKYDDLKLDQLKALCRARGLKIKGTKAELRKRLEEDSRTWSESRSTPLPSAAALAQASPLSLPSTPLPSLEPNSTPPTINSAAVLRDTATLQTFFETGFNGRGLDDEEEDSAEQDEDGLEEDVDPNTAKKPEVMDAMGWVDEFILNSRRVSGRKTESSVVKAWRRWVQSSLTSGIIPDAIVDANHTILYLKYAATRQVFNRKGEAAAGDARLSAGSLKKIVTMLGRIRRRQEDDNPNLAQARPARTSRSDDFFKAVMIQAQRLRLEVDDFDVTKGTILDSELRPDQLSEVTAAILGLTQLASILKGHFAWTWQGSTMNRGDELASLSIANLQPYTIRVPTYTEISGSFSGQTLNLQGVLGLFHETKTARPGKSEPKYSFVLSHRDITRCPVGALALLLHFIFDQECVTSKVDGWDWMKSSTWRQIHVLFGRNVTTPISVDALSKMYNTFLSKTSITHQKRTHLARKSMPTVLEDMGVTADQVDGVGHWEGGTRRQVYAAKIPKTAVVALAGFPVGEVYAVDHVHVAVPDSLQKLVFPFAEETLAKLRLDGCNNVGTSNFLQLLIWLRPFFWRTLAALSIQFPTSGINRLSVLANSEATEFIASWPDAINAQNVSRHQHHEIGSTFNESHTRNAFLALTEKVDTLIGLTNNSQGTLSTISRRTEQFSPSKRRQTTPMVIGHTAVTPSLPLPPTPAPIPSSPVPIDMPAIQAGAVHDLSLYYRPPSALSNTSISLSHSISTRPFTPPLVSSSRPPSRASSAPLPLLPRIELHSGKEYHILPLTPALPNDTQPVPRTSHDLILPPPAAFRHPGSSQMTLFPSFDTQRCTWQYIFDQVTDPFALWEVYAPRSLGDYLSVKDLWQAWEEGSYIADIGRMPALQLIDARWGNLKNQTTGKGRLSAWRPRKDGTARKTWSNFYFFVQRIQSSKASGQSSEEAVKHLDNGCKTDSGSTLSLNQLHGRLQVPRKRKRAADDED